MQMVIAPVSTIASTVMASRSVTGKSPAYLDQARLPFTVDFRYLTEGGSVSAASGFRH